MTVELLQYTVKDFMSSKVATIAPDAKGKEAIELMVGKELGSLIVAGEAGPVGIFTERDLLGGLAAGTRLEESKIADLMDTTMTKVAPSLGPKEAARLMTETRGRLLVFESGELVGVVTATDIVRVIWRLGAHFEMTDVISKKVISTDTWMPVIAVVKMMDQLRVGSIILNEKKVPRGIFTERDLLNRVLYPRLGLDQPVIRAATVPLVSANFGITGGEAANAMVARKIKRLPLLKDGRLSGIVTARDIVQAYAYSDGEPRSELEIQMAVRYGEPCPICHSRVDDRGLCACGAGGS